VIRWGVAGPGAIASGFADGMRMVEGGEIVAVASRARERADAFADTFGVRTRYGDYEALAEDPDVDAVYVATPQSRHAADTVMYAEAGKHVLCEKPFALNARQVCAMANAATAHGVFLMEAMWSRFLPAYRALARILDDGRIGDPLQVEADFGMRLAPPHRLFERELGGGALLDLGVYPVQLCSLVLGPPDRIVAQGAVGNAGVDEQVAAVLHGPGGKLGLVSASIRVGTACTARISGTEGWIDLPAFMHCPNSITVQSPSGRDEIDASYDGNGLRFQVEEVHRCLAAGLTESPVMSLDESIGLATTLDAIGASIGTGYMEAVIPGRGVCHGDD
jgi:predicted dehydrogenase